MAQSANLVGILVAIFCFATSEFAFGQTFPVAPPILREGAIPSTSLSYEIPPSVRRYAGSPNETNIVPRYVTLPLVPKDEFAKLKLNVTVCIAIQFLMQAISDTGDCTKSNEGHYGTSGVKLRILSTQADDKVCEFELFGKSMSLALKNPSWVERHRFFVEVAFDGDHRVSLLVSDHEPMLRTTSELELVREDLFEFIDRSNESSLRVFQDTVAQEIKRAIGLQIGGLR